MPNFLKTGQTVAEIFKMAAAAMLYFWKIRYFSGRSVVGGHYTSSSQSLIKIG